MNGKSAEAFLDKLANDGLIQRISKPGRTKAVIYQAQGGRHFAVIPESDTARLVFQRSPAGQEIDWRKIEALIGVTLEPDQLKTTGLTVQGAQLDPGNQQVVSLRSEDELQRVVTMYLEQSGAKHDGLRLSPDAITRWIKRLRQFFPDFDRFDQPLYEFDESERDYKLETAQKLAADLEHTSSDKEMEDAVHRALAESNLLQWRTYWPMSPKGDANRDRLWPALNALLQAIPGQPDMHPYAVETFVTAWCGAIGEPQRDAARQIAEFLLMHLNPEHGIYIRSSLRDELWREAVGSTFPNHESMADIYADELRFMQAVRKAFEERGLAPRDMIDIQSALWVVHSYESSEYKSVTTPPVSREAIEAAMDEYERLGIEGFKEAYPQFSTANDYWVRSTRQRSMMVFSSKPIVALATQPDQLSGGWSRKDCAAALLHNSGYIIVDRDNQPVAVPNKRFLIIDADRIRACARNYYIEPARERGELRVSIRAGKLNNELNLNEAWPNVCQALKGRNFRNTQMSRRLFRTARTPVQPPPLLSICLKRKAASLRRPEQLTCHATRPI